MSFAISDEHNDARLSATIAFADGGVGTGNSKITIYDANDVALAQVELDNPCGEVTAHKLVLKMKNPAGSMVLADGQATKADWKRKDGVLIASGAVTDASGAGPFLMANAVQQRLYAGGNVILNLSEIT